MKKNFFFSGLTHITTVLTGYFSFFIYARFFSVYEFGILSYCIALSMILGVFVDYGYNTKLPIDISKDVSGITRITFKAFYCKLSLSIIVIILISGITIFEAGNKETQILIVFVAAKIFYILGKTFLSAYRAINRFDVESKYNTLNNILLIFLVTLVLLKLPSLFYISLAYLVSRLIFLAFSAYRFVIDFGYCLSIPKLKNEHIEMIPYASQGIIAILFSNVDTVILKELIDPISFGLHQAGTKYVAATIVFFGVIYDVLTPKLANLYISNKSKFKRYLRTSNRTIFLIGASTALLIYFFREDLVILSFGLDFEPLEEFMWLFSILIFLRFFGLMYNICLTVTGHQKERSTYLFYSLIILITLQLSLGPAYGIIGILLSRIAANFILFSAESIFIKRKLGSFFL